MISDYAKDLIETWRLGYVASADGDGRVNLSPKGTFVVLDESRIAFAEMRSPNTMANIAVRPEVEVNFVDILSRKGARFRGDAVAHERGSAAFDELLPEFTPFWADLADRFNAIVEITLSEVKPLSSPAYDAGAEEQDLRELWKGKIQEMRA